MAKHSGRYGRIMMSVDASSEASVVVGLSSLNIDRSTETTEVTSFGEPNRTYIQGLPDVSGSFSGYWDDSSTIIFAAAKSSDGVKLYIYPDFVNNPESYFYGPAWVDASLNVDVGGAIGISANFRANGAWDDEGIAA